MKSRIYHRGHREDSGTAERFSLRLCVLRVNALFVVALLTSIVIAQTQTTRHQETRNRYQIRLALDYENRTYTGVERVRWVNRGDRATSTVFFHLYPNVRMSGNL